MRHTPTRRAFLQRLGADAAAATLAAGCFPRITRALGPAASSASLPRSTPEDQGVASTGILEFLNAVEAARLNLHSLMLVRHGRVVAEGWWSPYAAELRHTLYSLSKSFTSTAVGFAVMEEKLKLGDPVVSFFPDDLPPKVSPHLAGMRINDLLMMAAGHAKEALLSPDFAPPEGENWVKSVLAQPVEFLPGTHFTYNNGASFLLSAIVQKATGQSLIDYVKPRLFDPLGIEGADWETSPRGINCGGWGLRVRTEDIAKLGQLYLRKGAWNGKQFLPESWVDEATRKEIPTAVTADLDQAKSQTSDWAQGYGYQFWRCRLNAYRGDGAFGQFCIVIPKEDAVIAITSETGDMQAVLNAVWKHLVPAIRGVGIAAEGKPQDELPQRLSSLTLPLPAGGATSPLAPQVTGRTYSIADGTLKVSSASLVFDGDQCTFTMKDAAGEHRISCGIGRWLTGETDLSPVPLKLVPTSVPGEKTTKIAAAGAWSDDRTFQMHWRFIETAHYDRVTCHLYGDQIRIEFKRSLSILNPATKDDRPALVGKL